MNSQPKVCSFLWGYFDPERRALNRFEIKVLLNSIQCSSEEEYAEKQRELENFVNGMLFSAGVIAIAVFSKDWKSAGIQATAAYFLIKDKLWMTKEQYSYEFFVFGILFTRVVDALMHDFKCSSFEVGMLSLIVYCIFLMKRRAQQRQLA